MIGIYKIVNKINGKYYVGSSKSIHERYKTHRKRLRKNTHINKKLQNAWNKYGADAFELKLERETTLNEMLDVEQVYLDHCKLHPDECYNILFSVTTDRQTMASRKTRSERMKGSQNPMAGKKHSEETLRLMREHQKIYNPTRSEAWRKKMSIRTSGSGNPMYNRPVLDETRKKLSIKSAGMSNPNANRNIYSFVNKTSGEIFTGTRFDFYSNTISIEARRKLCRVPIAQ